MKNLHKIGLLVALLGPLAAPAVAQICPAQGQCSFPHPPTSSCVGGYIYTDTSQSPPQTYSCVNTVWTATGSSSASTADTRPNITQPTGKSGSLPAGGSYRIFSATGAGTITQIHVTLGCTSSCTDIPNLVQNSMIDFQCDGNFIAVPFGMFFPSMDAPKVYNTEYISVPVMGATFTGNVDDAMVFNRRTWINYYSGCNITLVNASSSATAAVFVDTAYRSGTPVTPVGASTSRAYWNAFANSLPAVPPNSSGSFNTPQVYLLPTSTFTGGGEVESITYFVVAANQSYLESGPVTWTDGVIATQSGGGEDWPGCGFYCNLGANEITLSKAGFIGGSFLQDPAGAADTLMWRFFNTTPGDNVPFVNTLAVSSANGYSGVATSPSIAMQGLVTFYTNTPNASVPQFSPAAGTYASTQSVTLTSYPSGSTTCYRTDGVAPTGTNGTCGPGSTTYSTPISVPLTATISAISTKSGFNNGILSSALYTITNTPIYVGTCGNTATSSSTTVVTCTMSVTAGDMAFVMCRGSNAPNYTITAPGDTFTQFSAVAGTGGYSQGSYAFGLAGGSTTFTCTASASTGFQGLQVLDYHPGGVSSLATSATNTISSSTTTFTSAAITTSGSSFVIACGNPEFGVTGTPASGNINGVAANNRTVNATANSMCEDQSFSTAFTSGTATLTGGSTAGPWDGIIAAFH